MAFGWLLVATGSPEASKSISGGSDKYNLRNGELSIAKQIAVGDG